MTRLAFQIETWTELGIGCLFVIIRICARWQIVGIRNFRPDDYLVVLMMLLWATGTGLGVVATTLGTLSSLTPAKILSLTPAEQQDVKLGSKMIFLSWILYVTVIWLAKTCLLFYYNSFTTKIWHQKRLIKITAWLLGLTYLACIITILAQCRPIQNNWRTDREPSPHCQYGLPNLYAAFSCHLLTDLFLLVIPVPILFTLSQVRLSLGHKLFLAFCVCTGIFTIAAAISTFAEAFLSSNDPDIGTMWVNREKFVWTILLCAPSIASIFRREFWSKARRMDPHDISHHLESYSADTAGKLSGKRSDEEARERYSALGMGS